METLDRSTTGQDNIVERPNGSSTLTSLSGNGGTIDTERSSSNKTRMKWSRDTNLRKIGTFITLSLPKKSAGSH